MTAPIPDADLVAICATLIRFDTTNYSDGKSNGERDAAEWVAEQLRDADLAHWNYVHGVDERVPIESLAFGAGVLGTNPREGIA